MAFKYRPHDKGYILQHILKRRKGYTAGVISLFMTLGYLNLSSHFQSIFPDLWLIMNKKKPTEDKPDAEYIYVENAYKDERPSGFSLNTRQVIKELNSRNKTVKLNAIAKVLQNDIRDFDCQKIKQSCTLDTAVSFSRHKNSKPSLLLSPPSYGILMETEARKHCMQNKPSCTILDEFKWVLSSLPNDNKDCCINFFTEEALKSFYNPIQNDDGLILEEHIPSQPRKIPVEIKYKKCLQALLRHSTVPENVQSMSKLGILQLLTRLHVLVKEDEELNFLIMRIIRAFSIDQRHHLSLHQGGWIKNLFEWSQSSNVKISTMASTILANLDSSSDGHVKYNDGVYLLHPQHKTSEEDYMADIIFVHGLKGNAFRTWRQKDVKKTENGNETTKCWPRDWLAKDIPNVRILAVEYESGLTEIGIQCPMDADRRLLDVRSKEIIEKLVDVGAGSRPIIWVSHSMGGLLVKQILVSAAKEGVPEGQLINNSAGVAFYSVPHRGTSIASKLVNQSQYLFSLSPDVKQLQQGSSLLLELNDRFKEVIQSRDIKLLSFGEALKTLIGLKIKTFIVDQDSANIGIGEFVDLPANHLNTCKPESPSSEIYTRLVEFIQDVLPNYCDAQQSIFLPQSKLERDQFLLTFG